ncbi:MAG TPA: YtxH domain-containing protein [Pelobium sp.]|jgi:gas vesicle protein|nr:YtxH domain-containing protein [Pelobium sp.]
MESKTKSKIALGLILGVAAGAAVYYFMTNEDGKQQLSDVIDAVKDFSDKAKNAAAEQSSKLADKASSLASQYVDKASNLASKYASHASDVTSKLAEDAQKNIERVG